MNFLDTIRYLQSGLNNEFAFDAMRGTLNIRKYRLSLSQYLEEGGDRTELAGASIKRLLSAPCDIDYDNDFDDFGPKSLPTIAPIGIGTYNYKGGSTPIRQAIRVYSWVYPVLVDTAETYGTEEIVGEAIKNQRKNVFLATKVARHHQSAKSVRNAVERSLKVLQVDYIDLYQIHWPSPTIPITETIGAMEDLVDEGKIRFIGVCNFSLDQLATARRSITRHDIAAIQNRYNLIDRSVEDCILPYAKKWGIKFIAYSPLAQSYRLKAFDNQIMTIGAVEESSEKTLSQIALRWLIDNGALPIPRSNSWKHLEENLGSLGWSLSKREKAFLNAI